MATRNSKATNRTIAVSRNQLDALHDGICDAVSLVHVALERIKEDATICCDSEGLVLQTLLAESKRRLEEFPELLDNLLAPAAKRVKEAA